MIQEGRLFSLQTPLGEDVLLLESLTGHEALSSLFEFELQMVSEEGEIAAAAIVGKLISFEVQSADGEPRAFNGFVNRFSAGGRDDAGFRRYRATVVPWTWFLTKTTDCRIFQGKTALEIAEQIFGEYGFADYDLAGVQTPPPSLPYCVQYRETDFDFVSRLWEDAGIYYYFRHEDGRHVLVLADSTSGYQDCAEKEVRCLAGTFVGNHLDRWEHRYEFITGKHTNLDYNYETPSTRLYSQVPTVLDLPGASDYEAYDYPGIYPDKGQGDAKTQVRMEEEEASFHVVEAEGNCTSFTAGGKFTLEDHDRCPEENGKSYVILSIDHSATDPSFAQSGSKTTRYTNRFSCMPADVVFRPRRTTEKPVVNGPQTALVVGPAGEEIYTDDQGRVKVQFHWDREGAKDEKSSCWIRVAQNWAGKTWGSFYLPRIGMEVVVQFLEGDPDRPLVVGGVYNPEQMPPLGLPGAKTQTTIKTRSTKGGGPANFNEIRFEDKQGSEELYVHAEKNKTVVVENDRGESVGHDETISIGNNRTEKVGVDETITIGSNRTESVGADETISIAANRTETVGADETVTIGANRTKSVGSSDSLTVGSSRSETVGASSTETVAVAKNLAIGAAYSVEVGAAMNETVGGIKSMEIGANYSVTIGSAYKQSVGADKTTSIDGDEKLTVSGARSITVTKAHSLKAKKITIEADDEIVIKTGSATLSMKKNGDIRIDGKNIDIKGSGNIVMKANKIGQN